MASCSSMIPIRKTIAPCDHARYEEFILQETDDTFSGFDAKDGPVTITIHYADDSLKAEGTFKDSGLAGAWMEQFKEMVEEATLAGQAEAEAKEAVESNAQVTAPER